MLKKLTKDDNLNIIANLIYESSHDMYNFFFENKGKSVAILEKLIELEYGEYSYKNIYKIENNNEIVGMIVISKLKYKSIFGFYLKELGPIKTIKTFFKEVLIHKYMIKQKTENEIVLKNISILEKHRGQHILTNVFPEILKIYKNKEILLDVEHKNLRAKKVYNNLGFKFFKKNKYCSTLKFINKQLK